MQGTRGYYSDLMLASGFGASGFRLGGWWSGGLGALINRIGLLYAIFDMN